MKGKTMWVMMSDHPFKRVWDILMIFMLGYVATLVPYNICLKSTNIDENINSYTEEEITALLVDLLFFIDIFVNFLSSYDDPETNLPVVDLKLIAKKYVSSWFGIDILAIFPFEAVEALLRSEDSQNSNLISVKLTRLARLPRLYKLLRVLRLLKMLRIFRKSG